MPPSPRKQTAPAQPATTEVDTSKGVTPGGSSAGEATPIHDQLKQDLANADPVDVTLFEEDDDPLQHVGDPAEDESGEVNPNEKENS